MLKTHRLPGLGLVVALGVLAVHADGAFAQRFRGPNRAVPVVKMPPEQITPLLNNGSLYTFVNPSFQNPSQLQFAYIAVAPQDCRLYHNGATIMPEHRLMGSLCLDSRIMPQQIQLTQGFIPQLPNGGLIDKGGGGGGGGAAGGAGGLPPGGVVGGWGMTRPMIGMPTYNQPYPNYYGNAFDYQRGFGGMNFPNNGTATLQANAGNDAAAPAANNFFNNAAPANGNRFGLANFAGGDNPFAVFGRKDDDKDKKDAKDEEKDKKDAKDEKKVPLK